MEYIPVYNNVASNFSFSIRLGDRSVEMRIRWNNNSEAWYMDIVDGDYSLSGIKIVHNWLLLRKYKSLLPDFVGDIVLLKTDSTITDDRPSFDNFGNGFDLFYVTETEAEEWENYYGVG